MIAAFLLDWRSAITDNYRRRCVVVGAWPTVASAQVALQLEHRSARCQVLINHRSARAAGKEKSRRSTERAASLDSSRLLVRE